MTHILDDLVVGLVSNSTKCIVIVVSGVLLGVPRLNWALFTEQELNQSLF